MSDLDSLVEFVRKLKDIGAVSVEYGDLKVEFGWVPDALATELPDISGEDELDPNSDEYRKLLMYSSGLEAR